MFQIPPARPNVAFLKTIDLCLFMQFCDDCKKRWHYNIMNLAVKSYVVVNKMFLPLKFSVLSYTNPPPPPRE